MTEFVVNATTGPVVVLPTRGEEGEGEAVGASPAEPSPHRRGPRGGRTMGGDPRRRQAHEKKKETIVKVEPADDSTCEDVGSKAIDPMEPVFDSAGSELLVDAAVERVVDPAAEPVVDAAAAEETFCAAAMRGDEDARDDEAGGSDDDVGLYEAMRGDDDDDDDDDVEEQGTGNNEFDDLLDKIEEDDEFYEQTFKKMNAIVKKAKLSDEAGLLRLARALLKVQKRMEKRQGRLDGHVRDLRRDMLRADETRLELARVKKQKEYYRRQLLYVEVSYNQRNNKFERIALDLPRLRKQLESADSGLDPMQELLRIYGQIEDAIGGGPAGVL